MPKRFRVGLFLLFTLNLVVFMTVGPLLAMPPEPLPLFSGLTQIVGGVQVEVQIDPPIAEPGQTIKATFKVTNQADAAAAPSIDILLPPTLSLDTTQLPIGLSFNASADHLTWLPLVNVLGESKQIALNLVVAFADVQNPEQAITVTLLHNGSSQTQTTPVWIGVPPQVTITPPTQVAVGQPVQLIADVTGPGPLSQVWDLGDGRVVQANNPTVVFPLAGTQKISVQVANPLAAATATLTLFVSPAPIAQFSADDLTPGVGQVVQFTNLSGGAVPLTYTWDFGDGTVGSGVAPQHTYSQPGTYNVHLLAQNEAGEATATLPIIVGQLPVADFIVPEGAAAGTAITLQTFSDPSVTQITWDMGDGRTAEGPNLNYTYIQGGDFFITMTAHNEFGSMAVTHPVTIQSGPSRLFLPLLVSGDLTSTLLTTTEDPTLVAPPDLPGEAALLTSEMPPAELGLSPAEQLLWYINEARHLHNLPPLAYNYELTIASQRHSDDMSLYDYTGHTGSDDTHPWERQAQAGYLGSYGGEVTYWGYDSVTAVVEFWINSPPHRTLILNPLITDVGVGYTYNPNSASVWYWVAEFGVAPTTVPAPTTETRLDIDLHYAHLPRHLTDQSDPT